MQSMNINRKLVERNIEESVASEVLLHGNDEDDMIEDEPDRNNVIDEEVVDEEIAMDIPIPSDDFMDVFDALDKNMPKELIDIVWQQYYTISQQMVLEGNSIAWLSCAIYTVQAEKFKPTSYTLSRILKACKVSPLEFFDKLNRWVEMVPISKRVLEQAQKVQGSLAVSTVIFKKLLPMYRRIFLLVDINKDEDMKGEIVLDTHNLFSIIWLAFLVAKRNLVTEDLMNCFNLLLCIIDAIYQDLYKTELDIHINPEFAEIVLSQESVLEVLCRCFEGVVLDAKHFRAHWFNEKMSNVFSSSFPNDINTKYKEYLKALEESYDDGLLERYELDERIFIPTSSSITNIFDASFDSSAIEILRRSSEDSSFADAELLLRMSTQSCLGKLSTKGPPLLNSTKSYIISSEQLCPITPISNIFTKSLRLEDLLLTGWTLAGSELEKCFHELRDNPLTTVALNADLMADRFVEQVTEEGLSFGEDYDENITKHIIKRKDSVICLFYKLIERIAITEREKNPSRDVDFSNVFRKEEFLASVFACALEIVLFSYDSIRSFPWSIQLFNLAPLHFHKIVEIVIRAEPSLSREMVKHLNRKEEEVLEEFGWTADSPLWTYLHRRADIVPSCETAWSEGVRMLANNYSPVKRRKLNEDATVEISKAHNSAMTLFFRKVYLLSYGRLSDLCERIKMDEKGKSYVWTILEHILRTETSLLIGRHLDQNLLCIMYVVVKMLKMDSTFIDIVGQYRHQPQAKSSVYREVVVDSSVDSDFEEDEKVEEEDIQLRDTTTSPVLTLSKVDLITYYNKVFLIRIDDFVMRLKEDESTITPIQMPVPRGFGLSPTKRTISDRVRVQALGNGVNGNGTKYATVTSPRKDIRPVSRIVNPAESPYFSVAAIPDKATKFGSLYRY